jgi:Uma2 family endonuclease
LRDSNYDVFGPDTKIRIQKNGRATRFYYPDGCVIGEPNSGNDHFQDRPLLIIEVLSLPPRELSTAEIRGGYITDASLQSYEAYSTRRTDEVEKRIAYQSIPSLKSYLLIEQHQPVAIHYRRTQLRFHRTIIEGISNSIVLPALSLSLPMRDVYEGISFAAE